WSQGIGLRLIEEGKLGFGSTNEATTESLAWLGQAAVAALRATSPDPFLELPKPISAGVPPDLELVDPAFAKGTFEERSSFLAALETEVRKRDQRLAKVLRASYREG